MGFKVHFDKGPWHGKVEDRKSAPEVVRFSENDEHTGIYTLERMTVDSAYMVWKEKVRVSS